MPNAKTFYTKCIHFQNDNCKALTCNAVLFSKSQNNYKVSVIKLKKKKKIDEKHRNVALASSSSSTKVIKTKIK